MEHLGHFFATVFHLFFRVDPRFQDRFSVPEFTPAALQHDARDRDVYSTHLSCKPLLILPVNVYCRWKAVVSESSAVSHDSPTTSL